MDNNEKDVDVQSTSCSSKASVTSSISMAAATARAKAKAAQARAAFSKREMEIKIEKASLEATLEALEKEREAEAALAEAAVMEAAVANLEMTSDYKPTQSSRQCTEQYVSEHSHINGSRLSLRLESSPQSNHSHTHPDKKLQEKPTVLHSSQPPNHIYDDTTHSNQGSTHQQCYFNPSNNQSHNTNGVIVRASELTTQNLCPSSTPHCSSDAAQINLARYLARSQLL